MRRRSCRSARRANKPFDTNVLSHLSAVVAGTAAAMHRFDAETPHPRIEAARNSAAAAQPISAAAAGGDAEWNRSLGSR